MNLTAEQQKAISYRGGDLQIVACAGAGKTEAISRRDGEVNLSEGRTLVAFDPFAADLRWQLLVPCGS